MICCHHQHFTVLFLLPQNQPLPAPLILYIYLCTKYYAINTLTRTHFAPHTTRFPPHIRRTLWRGKHAGVGRARKMVGAYPRTPARTGKHARTRTQAAPNARRPSIKRPLSGHNRLKCPHNFRKPPHRPKTPRACAISKAYITYFWHKISNKL